MVTRCRNGASELVLALLTWATLAQPVPAQAASSQMTKEQTCPGEDISREALRSYQFASNCTATVVLPSQWQASPPANASRPSFNDVHARSKATESYMRAVGAPRMLQATLESLGFEVSRRPGKGELVVVGTGIRVNQITLESITAIDNADVVLYSLADTLTETFIRERRPDALDLYPLYDDGKLRDETYTQTAEAMLAPVRLGLRVAAVFYGHPGIFDFPSHRAIVIARSEGLWAKMLPAVSASGNLYADLGVDPSSPGMQTMEATDLLCRQKALDPSMSAIIYQIGGIGDPGFNYTGSANPKFGAFVQKLINVYGADHMTVLYMANRLPTERPSIRLHTLAQLAAMSAHDLEEAVTGISTMFLPQKDVAILDDEILAREDMDFYRKYEAASADVDPFGYGPQEQEAVKNLTAWSMPSFYEYVEEKDSQAGAFLLDLALKSDVQKAYYTRPARTLESYSLTAERLRDYPWTLTNRTSNFRVINMRATVHRQQIHHNKIMHHHRVHNYYMYLVNDTDRLNKNEGSSASSSEEAWTAPPCRPNFNNVSMRKSATEAFMQAVADPSRLEATLELLGFSVSHRSRKGELVIVGTGIRVNQITLESIGAIDNADVVLYSLADTLTETFIRERRPDALDLYPLYDDGKLRDETYTQTAEAMLAPVRLGLRVAAVFYGHPGIFDFPSHRAISIARSEGLWAHMLPAVSASGNLYADLGVDPSSPGMQTMEATDLLCRQKALDPSMTAIIYQIGGIGDPGFNYTGSTNPKFGAFVKKLIRVYGAEHTAVLYMANRLPTEYPSIRLYTLAQLADMTADDLDTNVTGISTMLLPPKEVALLDDEVMARQDMEFYRKYEAANAEVEPFSYGPQEREAVQNLTVWSMPSFYEYLEDKDPKVGALLFDLALKPDVQEAYRTAPAEVLNSYGLTADRVANYPWTLQNQTSNFRVLNMRATVHRQQIHRNKIMHHHRVHNYFMYLVNSVGTTH